MTALDDAKAELEMWGRWGRQMDGPMGYGEPSIWDAWLSFKDYVAGWGLTEAEKEAERRGMTIVQGDDWQLPIDVAVALEVDQTMQRLKVSDSRSYAVLRLNFYKLRRQPDDDLYPALRHYCDITLDPLRKTPYSQHG